MYGIVVSLFLSEHVPIDVTLCALVRRSQLAQVASAYASMQLASVVYWQGSKWM